MGSEISVQLTFEDELKAFPVLNLVYTFTLSKCRFAQSLSFIIVAFNLYERQLKCSSKSNFIDGNCVFGSLLGLLTSMLSSTQEEPEKASLYFTISRLKFSYLFSISIHFESSWYYFGLLEGVQCSSFNVVICICYFNTLYNVTLHYYNILTRFLTTRIVNFVVD